MFKMLPYLPMRIGCVIWKLLLYLLHADDKDSSGIIDQDEISQMLKDIYGKSWEKNSYAKR